MLRRLLNKGKGRFLITGLALASSALYNNKFLYI